MEKKEYTITIKVTATEKRAIEANARWYGKTVSDHVRTNAITRSTTNQLAVFEKQLLAKLGGEFDAFLKAMQEVNARQAQAIKNILLDDAG